MLQRVIGFVSVLSFAVFVTGCAPGDSENSGVPVMTDEVDGHGHEHGHDHEHPETVSDAVHQLTSMRDVVRDSFAKGDDDAAHGPLHDVGDVLNELKKLSASAELSDDAKATIATNVETLLDSFGAVDKMMHGDEDGSEYSEVSGAIDDAVKAITDAAAPVLTDDDHGDHDHGDTDHENHDHGKADDKDHDHDDHGDEKAESSAEAAPEKTKE